MAQASSHEAIVRFFNSADDAKALRKYMSNLDEIIRGATVSLSAPLLTITAINNMIRLSKLALCIVTSERVKVRHGISPIIPS
jgi:hypothetical protein